MRKFLVIICVIALLMSVLVIVCEAVIYTTSVVRVEQERSLWCWAACAEMLAKSQVDTSYGQADIVQHVKGSVANVTGTLTDIIIGVRYISDGEVSYLKGNPLLLSATRRKIQSGYPVVCEISIGDNSLHHAVIIYKVAYNGGDDMTLCIYDPSQELSNNGAYDYSVSYLEFIDGTAIVASHGYEEIRWIGYVSVSGFAPGV